MHDRSEKFCQGSSSKVVRRFFYVLCFVCVIINLLWNESMPSMLKNVGLRTPIENMSRHEQGSRKFCQRGSNTDNVLFVFLLSKGHGDRIKIKLRGWRYD